MVALQQELLGENRLPSSVCPVLAQFSASDQLLSSQAPILHGNGSCALERSGLPAAKHIHDRSVLSPFLSADGVGVLLRGRRSKHLEDAIDPWQNKHKYILLAISGCNRASSLRGSL